MTINEQFRAYHKRETTMTGPCLCGDPYCPSCGNPERARIEAAESALTERLGALGLTVEEYALAAEAAEFAVRQSREAVERYQQHQRFLAEEERSYSSDVPGWARQD